MPIAPIILLLLLVALAGGFHGWSRGAAWYGGGWLGLALVLVVLVALALRYRGGGAIPL